MSWLVPGLSASGEKAADSFTPVPDIAVPDKCEHSNENYNDPDPSPNTANVQIEYGEQVVIDAFILIVVVFNIFSYDGLLDIPKYFSTSFCQL